jgi:CheY-like chemotaxis protein
LTYDIPVFFVSARDTLEERIHAYDSGGNDFIVKPADPEILLRKIMRAIADYRSRQRAVNEKLNAEKLAIGLMQELGNTGALLNFMRERLDINELSELADFIIEVGINYKINCVVQIRGKTETLTRTVHGIASQMEEEVLTKMATMGRLFQFHSRMIVNFDKVSVLITNMPSDDFEAGKLRDNISILAECSEVVIGLIESRKEFTKQQEILQIATITMGNLRELYREQHIKSQIYLSELVYSIERSYVHLGLSSGQEEDISATIRIGTDKILNLFDRVEMIDTEFNRLLDAIESLNKEPNTSWLF